MDKDCQCPLQLLKVFSIFPCWLNCAMESEEREDPGTLIQWNELGWWGCSVWRKCRWRSLVSSCRGSTSEGSQGGKFETPLGMIGAHCSPPTLSAGQEQLGFSLTWRISSDIVVTCLLLPSLCSFPDLITRLITMISFQRKDNCECQTHHIVGWILSLLPPPFMST